MRTCSKCGNKRIGNEPFCSYCGQQFFNDERETSRRIVYNGVLQKCPNCGEPTNPFSNFCETCGYEFRDAAGTTSVGLFSEKYQSLDSNAKRIDLIRTFSIPNTKTDIIEFFILASSNIDTPTYADVINDRTDDSSVMDVAEAWAAKLQQLEQKAELVLLDDPILEKIKEANSKKQKLVKHNRKLYDRRTQKERNSRSHRTFRSVITIIAIAVMGYLALIAAIFLFVRDSHITREKELNQKEAELNTVVEEIETLINNGDYAAALNKTELVYFHDSDYPEKEKKWENTRKALVLQIAQGENMSLEEKVTVIETLIEQKEFELALQMVDELKPLNSSNEATKTKWEEIRETERLKVIDAREQSQGRIMIPDIDFKGKIYTEVEEEYKEAGFKNVLCEKSSDILTGWFHDDGEVFDVSIDGSSDFTPGGYISKYVPIVIKYHGKIFE